ncbi:MAG: GGDEF domain-containing protein [Candidatus Methylomirabilia bacterium]
MTKARKKAVAFTGQRIRQRILLALILSSFIPLLLLTYVWLTQILPALDPQADQAIITAFQVLILFAALLIAAGAYVIWDVATAVARLAEVIASARGVQRMAERADEIGAIMTSFSRMVGTIEQQASDMTALANQLDVAQKELEKTNARLKELSFKDEVTELYNRRFFSLRLEEEISRFRRFNHPVSLVTMDLDDFKAINDELGHSVGDDTLRELARLILTHTRGINVICRLGGDEFAVLLVETGKSGAQHYAERIRQAVSAFPFSHGRRLTTSIGIASVPEDVVDSADDLLDAADAALYAAKRAGKNRVGQREPARLANPTAP